MALVATHGVEYLFPTVILCGLLQVIIGLLRMGKLIRMVPHPVMLGFVNGLAIVIGLAQRDSFQTLASDGKTLVYLTGQPLMLMLLLIAVTMAIIWLLPKVTRTIPASLAAILIVTVASIAINRSVETPNGGNAIANVGDMLEARTRAAEAAAESAAALVATDNAVSMDAAAAAGVVAEPDKARASGITGGLPMPFFMEYEMVPMTMATLRIIFPYAFILCGVGLIESLMTLTLIDDITQTRGQGNRECIGQGVANLVCGLFGGMGGCAMIGQSLINVNSGGRGRLSGITAAVCLLCFVLFLGPLITQISMAALVGVMFMVCLLYTSPSPRDLSTSRMPSSA